MNSAELADHQARERVRTALDQTLVVEAAAGTGKTTALVGRIIEVLRSGRGELARLVAVTFTEKAAGELKLRLRTELENARREAHGDKELLGRLEKGLTQLEEAHIGTIHGFCADLLKERPLQAGVDPRFEVATDDEADRLYRRVFDRWLEEKLDAPSPGIRRLLRQPGTTELGPVEKLYRAGRDLIERRDFPAPWEVRPFARDEEIERLLSRLLRLAEKSRACRNPDDYLYRDLAKLRSFSIELERQELASGGRDYDLLEHRLPAIDLGKRKGRGPFAEGVPRHELIDERDCMRDSLREFKKIAGADLVAHLRNELPDLVERYESLKEKAGRLDFLDLLVRARDLLLKNPRLREEMQKRFSHIFVDEFQDTDPLQAEILLLLAADDPDVDDWSQVRPIPGKLFVVADPKQSIYRFRRADVALYQQIKRRLIEAGAELVHLNVSFRATSELQEMVNTAMSEVMTGSEEAHQADYVPMESFRPSIENQPSVIALPIPRPYSNWGRLTYWAIQESEPDAVAAFIKWLVEESGWKVTSRVDRDPHPVGPSDICLLFRRFRSGKQIITQPYVESLQARDIPQVLVGGRGFHNREEIECLRNALAAIERPDDELAVFATLRGYLFSLPDEALFLFRSRHGPLHPFRKINEELKREEEKDVAAALDALARLHKGRNHRPIALTVRQLLDETRAQAGFALWQAGDQILANVLRILQMARNFEATGGISFRGFVDHLERLAEEGETTEQPLIEEGIEGVRLMTVHRAKGLEFPVVVLCDITCSLGDYASRHIDPERRLFAVRLAGASPWELIDQEEVEGRREAAESQRLLYVASTRARDLLVVPAVSDEARNHCWISALNPALYPTSQTHRFPVVAPGCPRFGDDTVIDRPSNAMVLPGDGIRPGQHKPRKGRHRVVWWDPCVLDEAPVGKPGVRRHQILQAKEGSQEDSGQQLHDEWSARRQSIIEKGSRASMRVTTATRKAEAETTESSEIEVEVVERVSGRPVGKAFGALVHEVLAGSDFDASPDGMQSLARSLGRVFGNNDKETDDAAEAARRALGHPLLRRAAAANRNGLCYRETPLVYLNPEGTLVEGIPDLVFRDDPSGPWTVIDFKTDIRVDIGQETYRRQVNIYLEALRQATGAEAKGVLLYV